MAPPAVTSNVAGEAQRLGEMPSKRRATAIEPGGNQIAQSTDHAKSVLWRSPRDLASFGLVAQERLAEQRRQHVVEK